jgi:protein-L-isoaspartate(D-aspartate) O-methyltransferase
MQGTMQGQTHGQTHGQTGRVIEAIAAEARKRMVDGQILPNKVTDPRLLAALRAIPRERFLPPDLAARAYLDETVRLPGGRGMAQPMVIARLLQALALRDGDRMLLVGAGTGYAAALAAGCGARVTALEDSPELAAIARAALAATVPPGAVTLVEGPIVQGHPSGAPYDAILIEGQVPAIPDAIAGQLAEGGRLVTVLGTGRHCGASRAVVGRRAGGSFSVTDAFDCATLPLPAFWPAPGFVF